MRKVDVPSVGAYVTHTYWNDSMFDRRHLLVGLVTEVHPDHNVLRTKPASGKGFGSWDPIEFPRVWLAGKPQWYELDPITSPPTGPPAQPLPLDPRRPKAENVDSP